MARQLVVYTRTTPCADVDRTRRDLARWRLPYREIDIEADLAAAQRVATWTGCLAVPTIVVTDGEAVEPHQPPAGLTPGMTPRNVDRGSLITEPSTQNLEVFLEHTGFIKVDLFRVGSFLNG